MKRALITGALGQDGSYLSEHLLRLGYEVWGLVRFPEIARHPHYVDGVNYQYGDLRDQESLATVIRKSSPDEIYNLAGQVFVPTSWLQPAQTFDVNVGGLARILDLLDKMGIDDEVKVYQASTSEMFGNYVPVSDPHSTIKLNEQSPMNPVSPYGVSKYAAHKLVDVYRQKGFYVVSGILFNHESPRRGPEMVTRKITKHVAQWINGQKTVLRLGSLSPQRDWGFAGDFVEAMHLMLQQKDPSDYVIGTGNSFSIDFFLEKALNHAFLSKQKLIDEGLLVTDCHQYGRRPELHSLTADYSKAKAILGWQPKTSFNKLVEIMVDADSAAIREEQHV